MAAGPFFPVELYKQHGAVLIVGSFSTEVNGPDTVIGSGFTIVKTGTGTYTLTLDEVFSLIHPFFEPRGSLNSLVHINAVFTPPTRTINLTTYVSATPTDLATRTVSFLLVCINTNSYKQVTS